MTFRGSDPVCKHCDQDIRYHSLVGWIHQDTGSRFCGMDAKRLAEPKR